MSEQQLGINVWLRDNIVPGLERIQRALNETSRKANEAFAKVTTKRFQTEIDEARRKVRQLEGDLAIISKFKATPKIEIDTKKKELETLKAQLAYISSKRYTIKVRVEENWSTFERNFRRGLNAAEREMKSLRSETSFFGKMLVFALMAVGPLVSAIASLTGAATALVGSLSLAAVALGGAFVAAIAQAVPVVLLLVAAFARVGAVFKAVQAQEKAATGGANDHTAALDRQRNAARNLIRAQEQLSDAHKNLAQARRQAKRDLEDLASAERRVRLEQESARLAMVGARRGARGALTGDASFLEFEQAQSELASSRLAQQDTARQGSRTLQDASRTRAQGVEGNQQVIAAQRALRDATWSLADAHREVARAQNEQGAAAGAALNASKDLSKAELELRDALIELRKQWKTIGPELTEPIIRSFTYMVRQITKLINDPGIQKSFKDLSVGIASSLRILFAEMTSSRNAGNFKAIMAQAAQNLPQIAKGIANLLTAVTSLARAADPTFKGLIDSFVSWSKGLKEATEDQGSLNKKIAELQPHLNTWLHFLGSIWSLFKEIVSVSAEAGRVLTEDIADKLDSWTQWLKDNRTEAKQFFVDASNTARILSGLIGSLIKELGQSTNFGFLNKVAKFIEDTFIPALGRALKAINFFSEKLMTLVSLPIVEDVTQWVITFAILGKALTGFGLIMTGLFPVIKTVITLLRILWASAFGPYVLVIGGIVVALVLLEKKFGVVSKAIEFLRGVAEKTIGWLKDNWQSVLLTVLTGPFGLVIVAFRKWGDSILGFFKDLGKGIGSALGNALVSSLNAVIDTINSVFSAIEDNWPNIPGAPGAPHFRIGRIGSSGPKTSSSKLPAGGGGGGGGFAQGGVVPGTGTGDIVSAKLTPGEVVLNRRQQQMLGVGRIYNVLGATGGRIGGNRFARGGIVAAEAFARAQLGEPYGRPKNGQSRTGPDSWDCSGYAGAVAEAAGATITHGATTGTYFYESSSAKGDEPIVWGFWPYTSGYNGGYDEHMGIRIGKTWYESSGSAGVRQTSRGDTWWKVLRVPRGLERLSSDGLASSSATSSANDSTKAARFETRDEFFRRITGYGPKRKQSAFLRPFLTNAYPTARRKIGDSTGAEEHTFSRGGEVRGREGEPRSIVAHAGEMILNRGQQAVLGGAEYLRKLFKPSTDTGHFAQGGVITSRLNITPEEATSELSGLNAAVRRLAVGKNVKTVNNLVSVLNILFEQIEERLTVLSTSVEAARKKIEIRAKTRAFTFSGGKAVQLIRSFSQLQLSLGDISEQRDLIQQQIEQTNKALVAAKQNLVKAQAFYKRNPKSAVAERRLQQAEKAVNLFGGQLQDLTGSRADLAQQEIAARQELARKSFESGGTALGTIDAQISRAGSLGQSTVGLIGRRLAQLGINRKGVDIAMQEALGRGDIDFAEELRKQIEALDTEIIDVQQQKINAAIAEVQKTRATSDRRLDLAERISKFLGYDITQLIDDRISSIRNQIGGLASQLGQADATGNTTLAQEIRDQIAELNQDIAEQYRRKFVEAREAADKAFSFSSSMNNVALQIAQISGPGFTPNIAAITSALQNRAALLSDQRSVLQAQLGRAGIEGDQDAVRDLTLALEENKLAILQNSQALAEVKGQLQDQTWTSSAWEQFRVAIFDGLGGLMPNMKVPALATGGYIRQEGLFKLHAGEAVIPADQVSSMGGDTYVSVNTPSPVLDPMMIAEDIGYQLRLRGRK